MSSKLFALDIGTRSVVGIILEEDNDHFHVQDILVKEHKERAMVDGQIHNVMYVAELINEIKQELEENGKVIKSKRCCCRSFIKNRAGKCDH
ncbi:Cell division protein FtsA OS=Lysinibacillus sphaericus OX=1421 GN=ftsA_1 PE=4 SV=1 [Lysinibacillus sphaericus]